MLTIPTYLAASKIEGTGVYTETYVQAGAIIWTFNPLVDTVIRADEMGDLPTHVIAYIDKHSWTDADGHFHIGIDNDKYINHSDEPNVLLLPTPNVYVASIDLEPDTEITEDYRACYPYGRLASDGSFHSG